MAEKINVFEKYTPEDKEFYGKILDEYKDRGLTEGIDEFILIKGREKIHFPKWREIPEVENGKAGSVKIRDFIEALLNKKEGEN